MAVNKISIEWGERGELIVTGSLRQPTIVEAINAAIDQRVNCTGAYIIGVNFSGEWQPTDEVKSLILWPYLDACPVCGHTEMFSGKLCPVCFKPWEET